MGEITVILVLALIFIGPKKLPELASGLGRLIREIRKTTADVKNEIQLDDAIRKPFEELRDAVTLHPEELKRRDRIKRELKEMEKLAAEQAARQAAALEAGEAPPPSGEAGANGEAGAFGDGTSDVPPPEAPVDGLGNAILPEATASRSPPLVLGDAGAGGEHHHHDHDHDHLASGGPVDNSAAAIALAAVPTEPSLPNVIGPNLTGTAPPGTVARGGNGGPPPQLPPPLPSGGHAAPPPPVASARRGSPVTAPPSSETVVAGSGVSSELLRALRPDSRKTPVAPQSAFAPAPVPPAPTFASAADRNNTTQVLSEADLATLASTPTPPPPPPATTRPTGKVMTAVATSSNGPPLPGSTPPKPPTSSST
jgi:Sec-independent protein translocase protein TatA